MWTGGQFDALADHPDQRVREWLAEALHVTPEQRARLVEDPAIQVLRILALGQDRFVLAVDTWEPPPALPAWAYDRLLEREPSLLPYLRDNPDAPQYVAYEWPQPVEEEDRDPAAYDFPVGPDERIPPVRWAVGTTDPETLRECAHSPHIALRRSVARNRNLPAGLIALLAEDDDFAVRLMLCESHRDVPPEALLRVYLEATTMSHFTLQGHPAFPRTGLARLADSPDPKARALVTRDPDAGTEVIDRLSRDPDPTVRARAAADPRLSFERLGELLDDLSVAAPAAANPRVSQGFMERVVREAAAPGSPSA